MNKKLAFFAILDLTVFILTLIFGYFLIKTEDTKINVEYDVKLVTGFTDSQGEEITLPQAVDGITGESVTLSRTISENMAGKDIVLTSDYCTIRVYVDGEKINAYGEEPHQIKGNLLGSIRVFTHIPEDAAGKNLLIEYTPVYDNGFSVAPIYVGTHNDLVLYILSTNIVYMFMAVALFVLFMSGVFQLIRKISARDFTDVVMYLSFGFFSFFAEFWILIDSDTFQFITNRNTLSAYAIYISLIVAGTALAGYCGEVFKEGRRVFRAFESFGMLYPLAITLGFVTGWYEPPQILRFTHIYLVLVAVTAIVFAIRGFRKKTATNEDRFLFGSILILMFFGLQSLWVYYDDPTTNREAMYLSLGIVFSSIGMYITIQIRQRRRQLEAYESAIYRHKAYVDELTGCDNRASYYEHIKQPPHGIGKTIVTLAMFDLNDLKKVNDNIGHDAGDILIKNGAECLLKTFSDFGTVFRMGGDEFCVVMWNLDVSMDNLIYKLEKNIEEINKTSPYKVSMAHGWACGTLIEEDNLIHELYIEADGKMYQKKREMKQAQSS